MLGGLSSDGADDRSPADNPCEHQSYGVSPAINPVCVIFSNSTVGARVHEEYDAQVEERAAPSSGFLVVAYQLGVRQGVDTLRQQ